MLQAKSPVNMNIPSSMVYAYCAVKKKKKLHPNPPFNSLFLSYLSS